MKKRHQFQVQPSNTKPQSTVKALTEADLSQVSAGEGEARNYVGSTMKSL